MCILTLFAPSPLGLGRGRLGRPRPGGVGSRVAALPCRVGAALGAPAPCPPAGVALCWGRACGGASLPPGAAPCWGFPGWVGFPPLGVPFVVPPGPLGCGVRASGDDDVCVKDRAEQSFAGLAQAHTL